MRSLLREPLLHFALLGALVFGLHHVATRSAREEASARGPRDARTIVLDPAFLAALARDHRERTGTEPDAAGRRSLEAAFVRDEVLYREARALGLDAGDVIVRRRLVQKMEFLLEGTVRVPEPREADLAAWLRAHPADYRLPERLSFRHVFFSRDRRGARTEQDARDALAALRAHRPEPERAPELGDPFLLGAEVSSREARAVASSFGEPFSRALASLPAGAWSGPVESSYGWHLVRVTRREPGRTPALAEVRERVERAWREERRERAMHDAVARLVASYRIERVPARAGAR